MIIEIDYRPSPSKTFFISVSITNKEAISFDNTTKGTRIIKQILTEKKQFPKTKKPSDEWDAIVIENKKFKEKYHVKWIDLGKKDWCNNEIWQTEWEKPLPKKLKQTLLYYSQLISDNYKKLQQHKKEIASFEKILTQEINKQTKPD